MKKALLVLSLSTLTLAACSKSNQSPSETTSSQAAEITASQVLAETPASQPEASTTATDTANPPVEGNAQQSLDWNGSYKGVLPCASCEGIETVLVLNADKTYQLSEKYLGKGDEKPFESKGKFEFDQTGNVITLESTDGKRQYFVSENHVIALNPEGKINQGNLAKHYELQKQNS